MNLRGGYPFIGKNTPLVHNSPEKGFTLLELMMVIAVAAILGALALPNMQNFAQNSRLTTQNNDLIADLNVARSEAIKRNGNVVICRSASATTATPACDTGGTPAWENGWLIFADAPSATGTFNNTYAATDGDIILRARGPLEGSNTLRGNVTALNNLLVYSRLGVTTLAAAATPYYFKICDSRGTAKARSIELEITGRARIARGPSFQDKSGTTINVVCP